MNSLYPSVNSLEWRRAKVLELSRQGRSQPEIARILQISQPTINRDLQYLRREAKGNIRKYIDDKLPFEYQKCLVGLESILARTWDIANNTESLERDRLQGSIYRNASICDEDRSTYQCDRSRKNSAVC